METYVYAYKYLDSKKKRKFCTMVLGKRSVGFMSALEVFFFNYIFFLFYTEHTFLLQ